MIKILQSSLPKSKSLIFINDPDRQNLIGANFISWIYLFNITETSACQSFYVGKFNNSLQLTKSALSALYNFIPLILNRKFILFKNINHTNCSLFLGQAALTACLLVLVNYILRWSAYTGPMHNWQVSLKSYRTGFLSTPTHGSIEELT